MKILPPTLYFTNENDGAQTKTVRRVSFLRHNSSPSLLSCFFFVFFIIKESESRVERLSNLRTRRTSLNILAEMFLALCHSGQSKAEVDFFSTSFHSKTVTANFFFFHWTKTARTEGTWVDVVPASGFCRCLRELARRSVGVCITCSLSCLSSNISQSAGKELSARCRRIFVS